MRTASLLLLLVACGGQAAGSDPSETNIDAGPASDSGKADTVNNNTATNACVETPRPSLGGAVATVNFDVTNTTSEVRFVVTQGESYAPIELTTSQGASVALVVNNPVACEGPAPRPGYPTALVRIEPGATVSVKWPAQVASPGYTVCIDCAKQGWPAMGVRKLTNQVLYPAPPGAYAAKLKVFAKLPTGCSQDPSSDRVQCEQSTSYGASPSPAPSLTSPATFTLAYPDVHVPVSL